MKSIIIIILLLSLCNSVRSQGVGEWFNQNKKQIEYMLKQIVLLQTHGNGIKNGYHIAKNGLKVIGDMKIGEFNLHKSYLDSLKVVSPAVKKYQRIGDIIRLEKSIFQYCVKLKEDLQNANTLQASELRYIAGVLDKVMENSLDALDELLLVITDNQLAMDDAARIKRIDRLYTRMLENYQYANNFGNKTRFVAINRQREILEIDKSKILNGLKK